MDCTSESLDKLDPPCRQGREAPIGTTDTKHSEKNDRTSSHVTDFTKTPLESTKTFFEQKNENSRKKRVPAARYTNS